MQTIRTVFLILTALLVGCNSTRTPENLAMYPKQITPYPLGSISKIHAFEGVLLAGQPTPEDFVLAKEEGIATVINIRHPDEIGFDEEQVVEDLGMTYHNLAWGSPSELTDDVLDSYRELLRTEKRPILFHCGSSNRVGAIWMAYRALDDGIGLESALSESITVGLRTQAYKVKVCDYVAYNLD